MGVFIIVVLKTMSDYNLWLLFAYSLKSLSNAEISEKESFALALRIGDEINSRSQLI